MTIIIFFSIVGSGAESARLRQRALGEIFEFGEIFEELLTVRFISYRKLGRNFSTGSCRWGKFSIFTADSAPLIVGLHIQLERF